MENKISRFEAREQGFFLVFEQLFNDDKIEDIIEAGEATRDLQFAPYAVELANGVRDNLLDIDETISAHLKKGWTIKRISKPSLAILRLALYEILFVESVPENVAINEAVELGKKYTINESKFINGVLGAIVRNMK